MLIRKENNIYIIKIPKEELKNFNIFNKEEISYLFQKIIKKIKNKYKLEGLLDINIYINNNYGMIIEINPLYEYQNRIDMKIHFHIDSIFMYEINNSELLTLKDIYYYKKKYYSIYKNTVDSKIIYKTEEILKKGIKISY